jgi:tetratricopeptide (TPR) repeat protein
LTAPEKSAKFGRPEDPYVFSISPMLEKELTQPSIPSTGVHLPAYIQGSRSGSKLKGIAGSRWQVGDKIGGRYEVHDLKKGGMGIVYLCYDHESQKPIVLKTFLDIFLSEKTQIERFMWEAETWVRLEKHMNIVRAYYVEKIEDKPYILMEYIIGEEPFGPELSSWIQGKGLNLSLSLNFAIQFCSGMLHAQKKFEAMQRPFVHRDIKPSNIMVTRDRIVKVTDFGLVKAFQGLGGNRQGVFPPEQEEYKDLAFTRAGTFLGTPGYMAPEQWLGEDIDCRADIYAFGCVLYEMLSGSTPFHGEAWYEYQMHHLESDPQPIPDISRTLNALILKCLEKKADKRYPGFKEIQDELQDFYHALTDEYVKVEESGENLEAWELLNKGVSLDNLGHHREAIQCYDEALRLNPQDSKVYNNRGTAYRALGQHEQALKDYDKAIELNPWYPHAYNNRGLVYRALGQHEQAVKDFDMVIQLHPWYPYAYNSRGLVFRALGQHEKAIQDFDMSIRLNPKDADSHNNRGLVYGALGEHERAIQDFTEAIRLDPTNPKTSYNRGLTHQMLRKSDEAIQDFDEAIRLDPGYSKAYFNRGIAFAALGQLLRSLKDFNEAIRLDPEYPHFYNSRGLVYRATGQMEKALQDFDEAIRLNRWFPHFFNNRGIILRALGRRDQALQDFNEAIKLNPKSAEAFFNRAAVLEQMDPREAVKAWEDYLRLAEETPVLAEKAPDVRKRIEAWKVRLGESA